MKYKEDYFGESPKLFYRSWEKDDFKYIFLVVHGFGEHSGNYEKLFNGLNLPIKLYAFDLLGHGKSDGKKGVVKSFSDYTDSLDEFFNIVKSNNSNIPIFLLGHSMGGLIILRYLLDNPDKEIKGIILSSPVLGITLKISGIKKAVGNLLSTLFPKLVLDTGIKYGKLTKDETIMDEYRQDKLRHRVMSTRLYIELQKTIKSVLNNERVYLPAPVLILMGLRDEVVSTKAIKKFYDLIKSPKDIKQYGNTLHEPFNGIDRQAVYDDVTKWLSHQ